MELLPLALALVFTASAQVLFKLYSITNNKGYLVSTLGLFCLAPLMSFLALKFWMISTVYMATAITYILVILMARFLIGEKISGTKMKSIAIIIFGVLLFNA